MNAKITWLCRKPQERNLVLVLQVWFRNGNQHIQYTSCHVVAHMWLLIVLSPLLPYNLQFLMCIYWLWKSASFWILWFLPSPLSELGLFATVLLRFSLWFVLIGTWVLHTFFLLLSRSVCLLTHLRHVAGFSKTTSMKAIMFPTSFYCHKVGWLEGRHGLHTVSFYSANCMSVLSVHYVCSARKPR